MSKRAEWFGAMIAFLSQQDLARGEYEKRVCAILEQYGRECMEAAAKVGDDVVEKFRRDEGFIGAASVVKAIRKMELP